MRKWVHDRAQAGQDSSAAAAMQFLQEVNLGQGDTQQWETSVRSALGENLLSQHVFIMLRH